MLALWLLILLPPLYVSPSAQDPFRLPKLMLGEWLAIASLVPLAWALRSVDTVRWRDVWGLPAVRAALPLALVASAGLFASAHPLHVRSGLFDLWIGVACLVGWSAALGSAAQARLLGGLLVPAAILAVLAVLQSVGFQPLGFAGVAPGSRLAITATAGNAGDLGAFLVLPCLIAQWRLTRQTRRAWPLAALALCAYALALTQTFAALAALLSGSLVFWSVQLWRSGAAGRRFALAVSLLALLAVGAVAAVPALRTRVLVKADEVRRGDWNAVLTGRVDGWRTGLWMLAHHPWAGVGHGAYRAEFVPAKLALIQRGVAFFNAGEQQNFVNAHDELVEVGADCGVPGLLALAWALWVLIAALRRGSPAPVGGSALPAGLAVAGPADRTDAALAWAGVASLAVLSLVDFPFRIALVAFPGLLLLAWVLRPAPACAQETAA